MPPKRKHQPRDSEQTHMNRFSLNPSSPCLWPDCPPPAGFLAQTRAFTTTLRTTPPPHTTQAFVPINNYSFDGLYRRHHPLEPDNVGHDNSFGEEQSAASRGRDDDGWCFEEDERHDGVGQTESLSRAADVCPSSPTGAPLSRPAGGGADSYARRMEAIFREEYGTFFDGMTQSARELYQVCRCAREYVPPLRNQDLESLLEAFLGAQTGRTRTLKRGLLVILPRACIALGTRQPRAAQVLPTHGLVDLRRYIESCPPSLL